jgi:hypothetical protein
MFEGTKAMISTIETYCGFVRTNIAHIEAGDPPREGDKNNDPWGVKSLIGIILGAAQTARRVYDEESRAEQ